MSDHTGGNHRTNKGGRKKGKTIVLTDTSIKEEIRAADGERKRKKDKQGSRKTKIARKSRKKLKLQSEDVDGDNTTSTAKQMREHVVLMTTVHQILMTFRIISYGIA